MKCKTGLKNLKGVFEYSEYSIQFLYLPLKFILTSLMTIFLKYFHLLYPS